MNWAAVGVGIVGLVWLSTTAFAPLVVGLLVAAIVYQALTGNNAVSAFVNWLGAHGATAPAATTASKGGK